MSNITEQYLELVALTKQHLKQEYSNQKFITSSPELFKHFSAISLDTPPPKPLPIQRPTAAPIHTPPPLIQPERPPKTVETNTIQPPMAALPSQTPVKTTNKTDALLTLHPLESPAKTDFREIKQIIAQHIPNYAMLDTTPDDQTAKTINTAWKQVQIVPNILILAFNETEKHLLFLQNIASAISLCIAPAQVVSANKIEQNQGWEGFLKNTSLRLVISSDYGIYTLPELMKSFKEQPKQGKHLLGTVPLLLLSDLSLYIKEPKLKSLLWRSICSEIRK